jgi:hypothetical protein
MTADTIELPELPEGDVAIWSEYENADGKMEIVRREFTADQMCAYATAAVLQERERCAKICEERASAAEQRATAAFDNLPAAHKAAEATACAAAIRAQKEPT